MSHFAVLVVTDSRPSKEDLQEALLPWHEYECTGIERYLRWVDHTGETKKEFDERSGADIEQYPTLAEYATEYHGYTVREDGRIGRMTNPDAKWDWWQVGGRYSGRLLTRAGSKSGAVGEKSWTNEKELLVGFDQAMRADLDLDAMKKKNVDERREWAEDCCVRAERPLADLEAACRLGPVAHAEWLELPEPRPRGEDLYAWLDRRGGDHSTLAAFRRACYELPDVPAGKTLAEWIASAPPMSAWAVVMDGQWFEHGKMGWWGISHDEQEGGEEKANGLLGLLRPDQWVTVVDCHI